ncbi:hypothetical protein IE53DRAFT_371419 [Violaceomyces palustris]|uniref:Uncharacterized protein n=1 Tax=Violaceomyces palustris TaxID=1673888 RepID=A0ACD0NNY5_9BASI|nr:hypothetical protein IE53DRAFT_371419 [Violaceomyces palustris]
MASSTPNSSPLPPPPQQQQPRPIDSGPDLRRQPTWVRSINFDSDFDLNAAPSTFLQAPQHAPPYSLGGVSNNGPRAIPASYPSKEDWDRAPTLETGQADMYAPPPARDDRQTPSGTRGREAEAAMHQGTPTTPLSARPDPAGARMGGAGMNQSSDALQRVIGFDAAETSSSKTPLTGRAATAPAPTSQPASQRSTPRAMHSPSSSPAIEASTFTPRALSLGFTNKAPAAPDHHPNGLAASTATDWESQRSTTTSQRPFSSADAYALLSEPTALSNALTPEGSTSRPGTSMSQLSGDGWMHDGAGNRSSYGTNHSLGLGNSTSSNNNNTSSNNNTGNQQKRGSVLSFQTALSGGGLDGFMSGDEGRISSRDGTYEEASENVGRPINQPPPIGRDWNQPWVLGSSGYSSSPDERQLPGALPPGAWGGRPASGGVAIRKQKSSSPLQQMMSLPPLDVGRSRGDLHQHSDRQLDPPKLRADVDLAASHTRDRTIVASPGGLEVPLSSTTGASSEDATQVGGLERSGTLVAKASPLSPDSPAAPPLPEKDAPFLARNAAMASPEADVIPPPLPPDAAAAVAQRRGSDSPVPVVAPADHMPVSDFRKKPLADISPSTQAAGLAQLQNKSTDALGPQAQDGGGSAAQGTAAAKAGEREVARRGSTPGLVPTAALAAPPTQQRLQQTIPDRSPSPSLETPSREPSPPPDGEVEARAEWERAQMRQKQRREDFVTKNKPGTFKGQLKPLQLVPASTTSSSRAGVLTSSPKSTTLAARTGVAEHYGAPTVQNATQAAATGASSPQVQAGAKAPSPSSGAVSTQQLQRLQAREQRRSVGALNAAMTGSDNMASGSNGPYPTFPSPTTAATKSGARQYPGLMPQRSLVPPFELQHRPDGLPSGLTGPDGVRRSINDPEVCLECMMRDEDMIDVHVVGAGLWERESDREFEEALRLEAEEEARERDADASADVANPDRDNAASSNLSNHEASLASGGGSKTNGRPTKQRRIGKGDPLTVERLKLHTQMNPPASSHRWRTLQTFLAVQAKYIAMEQQRLRLEADRRRSTQAGRSPTSVEREPSMPLSPLELSTKDERVSTVLKNRSSSTSLLRNTYVTGDDVLSSAEREEKEKDIASARAARIRTAAAATGSEVVNPIPVPVSLPISVSSTAVPGARLMPSQQFGSEDGRRRFSTPIPKPDSAGHASTPRRSIAVPVPSARMNGSVDSRTMYTSQDSLRQASSGSAPDGLAPPSRLFAPPSSSVPSTPSRMLPRSGASQLSLMHSGSMIDMHVGLEDGREHRLAQTGFLPGSPLRVDSPGATNRSYYGFPGDSDDPMAAPSRAISGSYGPPNGEAHHLDDSSSIPRDLIRQDSNKKKKKGLRGFFQKITGSSAAQSAREGSLNGSDASRHPSGKSQASDGPRRRRTSLGPDSSMDMAPPPGLGGLLSRARRSTSSLINPSAGLVDHEPDRRAPAVAPFSNPPGMASQTSLDLGPFQSSRGGGVGVGFPGSAPSTPGLESQRMRKPSNPLLAKYLSSPPLQQANMSQFSPVSPARSSMRVGSASSSVPPIPGIPEGRTHSINSYRSRENLGPPPAAGLDASRRSASGPIVPSMMGGGGIANGMLQESFAASKTFEPVQEYGDQSSIASPSRSSSRKGLPSVPNGSDANSMGAPPAPPKHARSGSGAHGDTKYVNGRQSIVAGTSSNSRVPPSPAVSSTWQFSSDASGRRSMQGGGARPPLPPSSPTGTPYPRVQLQQQQSPVAGAAVGSPGWAGQQQPRRPPKSTRRSPDGLPGSPSRSPSGSEAHNGQATSLGQAMNSVDVAAPESTTADLEPSRSMTSMDFRDKARKSKLLRLPFGRKKRESMVEPDPTRRASGVGGMGGAGGIGLGPPPPILLGRKSFSGLGAAPPKKSFHQERQRVLSSPAGDLPPRSHSAFGMLPTQRFASSQEPRRRRGGPFGDGSDDEEEDDDEDDDDDGMGRLPSGGNNYGPTTTTSTSFGRKSLNLIREGFRSPARKPSGEQWRKKFGL